jgi:hypothetical protein
MSKQTELKKLSQNDKLLTGIYKTVFDNSITVIVSKDKLGNEFLEVANCVKDFQTPLFEKVTSEKLREQIKSNLIKKV